MDVKNWHGNKIQKNPCSFIFLCLISDVLPQRLFDLDLKSLNKSKFTKKKENWRIGKRNGLIFSAQSILGLSTFKRHFD